MEMQNAKQTVYSRMQTYKIILPEQGLEGQGDRAMNNAHGSSPMEIMI